MTLRRYVTLVANQPIRAKEIAVFSIAIAAHAAAVDALALRCDEGFIASFLLTTVACDSARNTSQAFSGYDSGAVFPFRRFIGFLRTTPEQTERKEKESAKAPYPQIPQYSSLSKNVQHFSSVEGPSVDHLVTNPQDSPVIRTHVN